MQFFLFIVKEAVHPIYSKHYTYGDSKTVMHILTEERLRKWIFIGSNKRLVDWIFYGKIMFDRNEFLFKLRSELQEFPFFGRKLKNRNSIFKANSSLPRGERVI